MTDSLRMSPLLGNRGKTTHCLCRLALAFCLVLPLVHCAPAPVPLPSLDESTLIQRLRINADAYQGLRGMTRIQTENRDGSASARQVLLLSKPDRIRAELLNPFGQPLLLLATGNGELSVSLPREQRFLQGAATPDQIARFTGAPLSAEHLVRLALYDLPLIAYAESQLLPHPQGYRLLFYGDELQQRLEFDPAGRLLGATYLRGAEPVLEVAYSGFDAERGDFPRQVTVSMPEGAARFSLTYTDVELNPEFTPAAFTLKAPPGIPVETLP